MPDRYGICPWRKGVTSPYERLKISFEFVGQNYFKLHTIEVNNREDCNVKIMNGRRYDFIENPLDDQYLDSQLLRGRSVIDIDYLKTFKGLSDKGDWMDTLFVSFLETKDVRNPGSCELRAFVEIIPN